MALYHFCLRLRRNGLCVCLSITCRPRVGTADDKSLACLGTGRRILYDHRRIFYVNCFNQCGTSQGSGFRNSSNSFNYSCILSFSAVLDAFRLCLVGLRDSMRLDCIEAAAIVHFH